MNDEQREKLQQEVVRRYENLSDELKRAMMSVSSAEIIYEVGSKHGLNVEKIGILAEEVGYIMLGMIPLSGFISDLKDLLEVEENKAGEIAQEINHKIFLPIREEMKRAYGTGFSEEVVGGAPPQPSTLNPQPSTRPTPPNIPPRPSAEGGLGRPTPPPFQPPPRPEFGSGPRFFTPPPTPPRPTPPPFIPRPTPPPVPPRPSAEGGLGRPIPPPIFSQPKEITRAGEVRATGQPPTANIQPPTLTQRPITGEQPSAGLEVGGGKLEVGLPEVEEELKPKKLLESLPKEKPLEARIAEKNPPKYHLDPYKEPIE